MLLGFYSESCCLCLYFEVFAASSFSFLGFNSMFLISFELTFVKREIISFFYMLVSSFSGTICQVSAFDTFAKY